MHSFNKQTRSLRVLLRAFSPPSRPVWHGRPSLGRDRLVAGTRTHLRFGTSVFAARLFSRHRGRGVQYARGGGLLIIINRVAAYSLAAFAPNSTRITSAGYLQPLTPALGRPSSKFPPRILLHFSSLAAFISPAALDFSRLWDCLSIVLFLGLARSAAHPSVTAVADIAEAVP